MITNLNFFSSKDKKKNFTKKDKFLSKQTSTDLGIKLSYSVANIDSDNKALDDEWAYTTSFSNFFMLKYFLDLKNLIERNRSSIKSVVMFTVHSILW